MQGARTGSATLREWLGLGLLTMPTMLLGLDVTILYLVLPAMTEALAPTATQTLWIMDSCGLLIAGFLITMGTLGDRIGRRRLLSIGMAAFAAASMLAAFASSPEMLIMARVLLGIAGATLMPSTLSLISNMFPDPSQRAVAIGVWATAFALGMAAGPIIGGLLVGPLWWGAGFLLAVPIAVIVLTTARAVLPECAESGAARLDLISVGLSLVALLGVLYAIKRTADVGVDALGVLAFVAGVVSGVLFVRRQRRLAKPLLDLRLFTSPGFTAALMVLLLGLIAVGGPMYLVTQYLQLVAELRPLAAGLWMGPPALAMLVAALGAPVLARRIRPGIVMGATLAMSLIGYALLAAADTNAATSVVVGFAFVYLGLGAIAALGTDIVVGSAPVAKSGSAASLSETVQELGVALGVALLGSVTTLVYRAFAPSAAEGTPPEARQALCDSLAAAMLQANQPESSLGSGTVALAQQAFVTGMNVAAVIAGVIVAVAVIICVTALRRVPALSSAVTPDTRELESRTPRTIE